MMRKADKAATDVSHHTIDTIDMPEGFEAKHNSSLTVPKVDGKLKKQMMGKQMCYNGDSSLFLFSTTDVKLWLA